ncbi:UNVERIFIED_CONTAM: hypothetical protein HDU68_007367 [Siphonaria sp. JEL0065]|nr:hypothetical protein HDU68_007367 [Siphonaria sp. JEL0065]
MRRLITAVILIFLSLIGNVLLFVEQRLTFVSITSMSSPVVLSLWLLGSCVDEACTTPKGVLESGFSLAPTLALVGKASPTVAQNPAQVIALLPYSVNSGVLLSLICAVFFGATGLLVLVSAIVSMYLPNGRASSLPPLCLLGLFLLIPASVSLLVALACAVLGSTAINSLIMDSLSNYGISTSLSIFGPLVIALAFFLCVVGVSVLAILYLSFRSSGKLQELTLRSEGSSLEVGRWIPTPKSPGTREGSEDGGWGALSAMLKRRDNSVDFNQESLENDAAVAAVVKEYEQSKYSVVMPVGPPVLNLRSSHIEVSTGVGGFASVRPVEGLRMVEEPERDFDIYRVKSQTASIIHQDSIQSLQFRVSRVGPPLPAIQTRTLTFPPPSNSMAAPLRPPSAILAAAQPPEVRAALVKQWERRNSGPSSPTSPTDTVPLAQLLKPATQGSDMSPPPIRTVSLLESSNASAQEIVQTGLSNAIPPMPNLPLASIQITPVKQNSPPASTPVLQKQSQPQQEQRQQPSPMQDTIIRNPTSTASATTRSVQFSTAKTPPKRLSVVVSATGSSDSEMSPTHSDFSPDQSPTSSGGSGYLVSPVKGKKILSALETVLGGSTVEQYRVPPIPTGGASSSGSRARDMVSATASPNGRVAPHSLDQLVVMSMQYLEDPLKPQQPHQNNK